VIASLVLGAVLAASPVVQQAPMAITGVTIVDPRSGSLRPRSLVVVDKQRITYAGAASTGKIPRGARVVDGRGRFLIPGLWDMHVHISPGRHGWPEETREYYFAVLLANGVTGVRDMAGSLSILGGWRARVVRGELLGPRLVIGGNKIGSGTPVVPGAPDRIRSAADLRLIARLLKEQGADHVKIGDMPPGLMPAAEAAARAVGLHLVGHLPLGESAGAAIESGYRSIEHMHNILAAGSTDEAGLLQRQFAFVHASQLGVSDEEKTPSGERGYPVPDPETIEDRRILTLAAQARERGTWFTPTLRAAGRITQQPGLLFGPGPAPYRRPLETLGRGERARPVRPPTAGQQAFWDLSLRSVGLLHRGGAHLLAGTDSPNSAAGFSLGDELELLVRAGLPPAAALRAATSEAADYLAAADSMGTIRPGFVADLVLLDGNPLEDIANVRRIRAVVVRGRLLERPALDSLLARAAALAPVAWSRNSEP